MVTEAVEVRRKEEAIKTRLKWRTLLLLSLAELLGMAVWFSASAVVPALTSDWSLNDSGRAWLTMSVQIGFVVGAFGSSLLNLADRIPARRLFTVTALLAGIFTALIPAFSRGLGLALVLRFLTGMVLAGVYPIGMKIMATWTKEDRGLGIGLLVGALIAILFVDEGPYRSPSPRFSWNHVGQILRQRDIILANLGYLGHMWELFAMWTWIPIFLLTSFESSGVSARWASLAAFAIIAAGGLGSLLAGQLADKLGRTTLTIASLLVSGTSALIIGQFFGGNPVWLVAVSLIWGFSVVADSAQFSACVSELCRPELTGTALTLQTSLGFLLTLVTIRLVPNLVNLVGWNWAFAFLALGPAVGIWAMGTLRRSASASRLAGGKG